MPTPIERFMEKVIEDPEPPHCWIWTGALNSRGYGSFSIGRSKSESAHRWIYEYHNGPIPPKYQIHHTCEVKRCVHPEHLKMLTQLDHARTHAPNFCKRGHPLFGENVRYRKDGRRVCRTCNGWQLILRNKKDQQSCVPEGTVISS